MPTNSDSKPASFEDAFRLFVQSSLQRAASGSKSETPAEQGCRDGQVNGSATVSGLTTDTGPDTASDEDHAAVDTGSRPVEQPEAVADAAAERAASADGGDTDSRPTARQATGSGRGRRGPSGARAAQKRALSTSEDVSEVSEADAEDSAAGRSTEPPAKRARGRGGKAVRGRVAALNIAADSSSDATNHAEPSNMEASRGRRRSSRRLRPTSFSSLLAAEDEDDPSPVGAPGRSDGSASDEWTPKQDRREGTDDAASSGDEFSAHKRRASTERGKRGRGRGARGGRPQSHVNIARYQLPKELEEQVHGPKPPPETPMAGGFNFEKPPVTGDFLISVDDIHLERPPIWRIDGKFLIQKYEPIRGRRQRLYKNMATYMSWSASSDKFRPLNVRYHQMGKNEIIVELLDNPHSTRFNLVKAKSVEATSKYLENFEIYMQTLISQALDANFLLEVMEDEDEYFMKNVNIIKGLNNERKEKIMKMKSWNDKTQAEMDRMPCLELIMLRNVPPSECAICGEVANPRMVQISGRPYDSVSLQSAAPARAAAYHKRQHHMCSFCAALSDLYHKLVHQMFHLYLRSCEQVTARKKEAPDDDSTRILNVILADEAWLAKMFGEVQMVWAEVDQMYQGVQEEEQDNNVAV